MQGADTRDETIGALAAATVDRQWEGKPVHEWSPAKIEEGRTASSKDLRVEEFMTTDLFTVRAQEPIDLVVNLMDWKHIRHVPVEDDRGPLGRRGFLVRGRASLCAPRYRGPRARRSRSAR